VTGAKSASGRGVQAILACRNLLLHFRPTWMWEMFAGAGSASGPAFGPSMDVPKIAPAFSTHMDVGSVRWRRERQRAGVQAILDIPKIAPAFSVFSPSMDIKKDPGTRPGSG